MKSLLTISFLVFTYFCFGQTQQYCNAEYNLTIPYRPATIQLLTDTNSFPVSTINNTGKLTYTGIRPGHYKFLISGQGQASVIRDSIFVGHGQKLVLNFTINGPCLFEHAAGYIPRCPKNHTDSIIPIIYGLVATKIEWAKTKKDMKAIYAGCSVTDCDPRFYCKEHDIEF